jgi:hypothetical protein
LVELRPEVGGKLVTWPLAAPSAADAVTSQVEIDLVLQNGGGNLTFDHARLRFTGPPAVADKVLNDAVRRSCNGNGSVTMASDPVFPAGQTCRFVLLPDLRLPFPAPASITIEMHFAGFDPLTIVRPLAPHVNPTPTGSYRVPARATDLPAGTYWSGRASHDGSHHRTSETQAMAYDMGVVRFDSASGDWVATRAELTGGDEDYLVYNMPVYAIADGVVEECVDDQPDDGSGTANKFIIRHGDEYALYAHLREGLSNPALCFPGAAVKEGDYLGRAGRSGTDTPHLHLHVQSSLTNGQARPLLFHDAFLVARDPLGPVVPSDAPWAAVRDAGLPWERTLLWPAPLLRRGEATGAAVQEVAVVALPSGRVASATRTAGGQLAIESWSLTGTGGLSALGSDTAGAASQVSAVPAGSGSDFITAVRDGGGLLKVIGWRVEAAGAVSRLGDDTGGGVSEISLSRLPQGPGAVTAVRTAAGNLKVIAWRLTYTGQVQRGGDDEGGAVTQPAVVTGSKFGGVVTAARNAAGQLELATWSVSGDAAQVTRVDTLTGPQISDVVSARPTLGFLVASDVIVTAARSAGGSLLVQSWRVDALGNLSLADEHGAGAVSALAASVRGRHVLTSVRDGGGDLLTLVWRVGDDGLLRRVGEVEGGAIDAVALSGPLTSAGTPLIVTAVRTAGGALKLIAWQTELQP